MLSDALESLLGSLRPCHGKDIRPLLALGFHYPYVNSPSKEGNLLSQMIKQKSKRELRCLDLSLLLTVDEIRKMALCGSCRLAHLLSLVLVVKKGFPTRKNCSVR